jgi:uncharacterized protein
MKSSEASRYGLPEDAINKILLVLADYPGIERVILYGSRAKGNFRPSSDIDLCLQAPTLSLTQQLAIETRLDDLLLPWKIDLVLAHHISNPALIQHIERVGVAFIN